MTDEPDQLETPEEQTYVERYPVLDVRFDPVVVRQNAIHELFRRLLALDMDKARAVLSEPTKLDEFRKEPYITVIASDEGHLDMGVDAAFGIFIEITVDPAKFDRSNPEHEILLQRCAAIVKAVHESPIPQGAEHPVLYPFIFWKWIESDEPEHAVAKWAKLAEIWEAASK
jgi:hypothetical protein